MGKNEWYEDPIYIKMCEKAVEVQDIYWGGPDGEESPDWVLPAFLYVPPEDRVDNQSIIVVTEWDDYGNTVWLPLQHQLQKMVQGTKHSHLLAHEFALWCHGGEEFGRWIIAFPCCDWSMSQLWLAFVMKENHNKVWNGEDWVQCGESS